MTFGRQSIPVAKLSRGAIFDQMPFSPNDAPPDRPAEGWERWTSTIALAVFLGLMGAEIARDFEPAKLSAIFIPLFWIPLVALHEAGHALVARVCGWEVERVVIGFGKLLRQFKLGSTSVQLRQVPIEGFVLPYPKNLHRPRLKQTLIYAGGPAAEALLVAVVYFTLGGDVLLAKSHSIPIIAAQSLCVSAIMGLVFTLVPHTTTTGGGRSWSDGMGILMSWRLPDSYFERMSCPPDEADSPGA